MLGRSSRSRNFFRKLVVNGVNNSKAAIQNDCLMRLYDADAELKAISSELDSFDGKKDPIRCNLLVNQLRTAQDKVISLLFQLMDDCNCERASRDYRMKFPDEILLSEGSESLNGQIWFGAECLSAGSNILNHTKESTMLRPMAKTLTQHLDSLRNDLRDLVIDGGGAVRINLALIKKMVAFDHIFATFEYEYVRTMLPIRTVAEIEKLQEVAVLFSETLIDCVKRSLIKQEDIDEFQPIIMIAIPRLAIVRGLLYKNENPIYTRHKRQMCSLFQPFHGPLHSIRKLLRGLSQQELITLERMLANDQSSNENQAIKDERATSDDVDKEEKCMQCNGARAGGQPCACGQADQAGTSNNYSNVLMDGLQYPVGQKRSSDVEQAEGNCFGSVNEQGTDYGQTEYNCFLDAPASSSKSLAAEHSSISPADSTPSPSSSLSSTTAECNGCVAAKANDLRPIDDVAQEENVLHNDECDQGDCCLSPPDSEAQMEKLIANFGSSMGESVSQDTTVMVSPTTCRVEDAVAANSSEQDMSSPGGNSEPSTVAHTPSEPSAVVLTKRTDARTVKSDTDPVLEEIIQRQAQQLLHRLFVAISGVADQLQSNFASDLRFILRHIFSSELAECDEQANEQALIEDDGEYSNNDQSESSLPIEQGIEAQEVANLIDLESGYSPNETYPIDRDVRFVTAQGQSDFLSNSANSDMNRYSGNSLVYSNVWQSPNNSEIIDASTPTATDSRVFQDTLNGGTNSELLADLMRSPPEHSDLLYESESSPNDPSIMDDAQHHRHLVQQHLQSVSRRSHRSGQAPGSGEFTRNGQHVGERRSRHHHSSSRSRRPRGPPVWVPDQLVVQCSCCNVQFTLFRRRHHCRACGQIFCADCSRFTKNLNCWGYNGPVRVCESCYNQP